MPVEQILSQNSKYIYGANIGAKRKYSFNKILHGSSDRVDVEMVRDGQKELRTLSRYSFEQFKPTGHPTKQWKILDNNVGYINLGRIDAKELSQALDNLHNTKSIILDLRSYPKEFQGNTLKNYFGARCSELVTVVKPYLLYPGKFEYSKQTTTLVDPRYKGKVVLIVNQNTQSRAEYTAVWIQNGYNVTTVGSQTAGAGGVMISIEFLGGYHSNFTNSGFFYPDMSPIQREGVKIDIEVNRTLKGVINGTDELLEKAIEIASQ
tara:strand:+ start:200 stop:991 length:792 start_codon:yes stop_codon:yes gene_type:complete